jgi:hypothetical protein
MRATRRYAVNMFDCVLLRLCSSRGINIGRHRSLDFRALTEWPWRDPRSVGAAPRWQLLYSNPSPHYSQTGLRGLTAASEPGQDTFLLAAVEGNKSRIRRRAQKRPTWFGRAGLP